MGPIHPKLYDWSRGFSAALPEKCFTVGKEIWDRNYIDSETMPEIAISVEESAEYSALMSDIKTFVEENTVKFIIGDKPLTEWNSYVEWINSHGLDRCLEIQQSALERYNKR
jgi:putative aldouronate transport system substrate-binding protein